MAATKTSTVIVQYIALRGDLLKVMKWPLGAVVAQACHASIAAIVSHGEEESVKAYIHKDNMNSMHKVVVEVGPTIDTPSMVPQRQLVNHMQRKFFPSIFDVQHL